MKKQVPIFVAGSKEFREQRLALKAMANDLNAEFLDQKKDVVINMWSYENFGNHQQEYNQFISDIAELVIFVLDGGIGEYTESEFRLAVAKYKKDDSPKILVFLKDYKEKTDGIQKIEDLLEEAFGPEFYYISYRSTEELCTKAKEHIRQHANHYLNRKSIIRRAIGLFVALLLFIASFTTAMYFGDKTMHSEPDPMLVFAGGGSAANYLKKSPKYKFDVRTDDQYNLIFINMPSTQAYVLLRDEIYEKHARDQKDLSENEKSKNSNFYPICLSAKQAKVADFEPDSAAETGSISQRGIILSCFIGFDTLETYFYYPDGLPDSLTSTIKDYELEAFIRNADTMMVFTTNEKSGTYITYQDNTNKALSSLKEDRKSIFYDSYGVKGGLRKKMKSNKKKSFVVLGSRYYAPIDWIDFQKSNAKKCMTCTISHQDTILAKTIYVYMVAYADGETYTIPRVAQRFLKETLHIETATTHTLKLRDVDDGEVLRSINDFDFVPDKN